MRRTILFFLAAAFLVACGSATDTPEIQQAIQEAEERPVAVDPPSKEVLSVQDFSGDYERTRQLDPIFEKPIVVERAPVVEAKVVELTEIASPPEADRNDSNNDPICHTDTDCNAEGDPPYVVCEENRCKAGLFAACVNGCSKRYPCDTSKNICTVDWNARDLGPGAYCAENRQCASGLCDGSEGRWGIGVCAVRAETVETKVQNEPPALLAPAPILLPPGCEEVKELLPGHNKLGDQRVNLIFVGVGWPKEVHFREEVLHYTNFEQKERLWPDLPLWQETAPGSLFGLEPFRSNKDRFNVWVLDRPVRPYRSRSWLGRLISWGSETFFGNAGTVCELKCLTENGEYKMSFCPLPRKQTINLCHMDCRASARFEGGFAFVSVKPTPEGYYRRRGEPSMVIPHEFGHSFGQLKDEYYYSEGLTVDMTGFPNCAPDYRTAQRWWGNMVGQGEGDQKVGYYRGCSYSSRNWRPTRHSRMDASNVTSFGPVNTRRLCDRILQETGSVDAQCQSLLARFPSPRARDLWAEVSFPTLREVDQAAAQVENDTENGTQTTVRAIQNTLQNLWDSVKSWF